MIALQLIQGLAIVLFIAGAGLAVCVAADAGIEHRALKRVIKRMRPARPWRPRLQPIDVATLVEIRARIAYGQFRIAIQNLSEGRRHRGIDYLYH